MASNSSANPKPNPAPGGLSLYANLLKPAAIANTITSAPVLYNQSSTDETQQDEASIKKQISAAALRFQPTKRPQLSNQKPKPKSTLPKPPVAMEPSSPDKAVNVLAPPAAPAVKTTLADWTADDDDVNGFYMGEKRQRGGRKKRKKHAEEKPAVTDWDEIYDPTRPTDYHEYMRSDARIQAEREWKDRLYAHRMARRESTSDLTSEGEDRYKAGSNKRFAPPPNYSFAPPPIAPYPLKSSASGSPAPAPPAAEIPDDPTGEDAYARRLRMSGMQYTPPPHSMDEEVDPPSPPPSNQPFMPALGFPDLALSKPGFEPSISASATPVATVSRAPVRYNLPAAPTDMPASESQLQETIDQEVEGPDATLETNESDEPSSRSKMPGQKGFAQRLMAKYGWTKGTGLGAAGTGIVNPLRVQIEKRKQKPDSQGGGFVGPGGKGKIIGGKKKGGEDEGKFGAMSEVIVLKGMLDGLDLDAELGEGDGGVLQEIGEECGEKYGRVERVFIDRSSSGSLPVFVKFTSQLSALRAVNALEGRIFNGNAINARFFDADKFEKGIYE